MSTEPVGRVAALYDIHGNLPALEAVLRDVRHAGVDCVVVGGDVVPGPMPRETLACLRALEIPTHYIRGNGDRVVRAQMTGGDISEVPLAHREPIRWTAQQLGPADAEWLGSWPEALRLDVRGCGEVLFCHATPRNDTDIFTSLTAEDRLRPLFDGVEVSVVICGHTHMQFDRMIGRVRVVNAGSVGMPFEAAGAYWLLLGPGIQLRRTPYDLAAAAERIRNTTYPQANEFAERNVLNPPSAGEMLDAFTRISMQ
jgi:putative phosphoesterase